MNKLEIAFLVNPLKTKAHTREYVLWVLEKSKEVTDIEITIQLFDQNWPKSLALFDRIWLLGGDGTMCYFINQYPNCSQPISLFKGGTGNDFYWKIYKNISREDHFQSAIYGQIESVDAGICNGKYFLNGVGMGIEGEVLKSMKSIRILGGFLGYFLAAIPHIFTFKSYTIAYQDNHGKRIQKKVFLCMVFNSSRAGGGFLFAPMASIQDGKLNMLICDPIHILKRIIFMPTVQFGWHVHFPFVQTMEIDEITISADRVLRAQVDGEMLESNEFVFQVLPNHFQFCFPKL